MFKILKSSLIILFLINLTACSYSPDSLKETYNDLASEMSQGLKEPFDLSSEQNAIIDDYTKQLFIWHRRNKLPEYAQSFAKLAVLVKQDNPHLATLKKILEDVNNFPHIHQATHLTPKMEKLAKSLTKTQIAQLEQVFKDAEQVKALEIKNQNYVADIHDTLKSFFRFLGVSLNTNQLKVINTNARKLHDIRNDELLAEKRWSQQLIALLRHKNTPDFSARFANHWESQNAVLSEKALQLQQHNKQLEANLIKTLIVSFTPKQSEKIARQLTSMSNTFSEMANE